MANTLFVQHGGCMPGGEEAQKQAMEAWGANGGPVDVAETFEA